MSGITFLKDWLRVTYFPSVVERAISISNFEDHIIGQFAKRIMYSVRDMTDEASFDHVLLHSPSNDAS